MINTMPHNPFLHTPNISQFCYETVTVEESKTQMQKLKDLMVGLEYEKTPEAQLQLEIAQARIEALEGGKFNKK
jgi:hypothetical protein